MQLMTPASTSVTWNNVGTLGFLAPPSTQITSAIRQEPSVSEAITVMPALTCRKTGSDFGAATALAWSTDISNKLVQLYCLRWVVLVNRGGLKKTGVFGRPSKCQQKFPRPIYVWAWTRKPPYPLLRGFAGPAGGLVSFMRSLPCQGQEARQGHCACPAGARRMSCFVVMAQIFYRSSVVTNSVTKGVTKALGGLS